MMPLVYIGMLAIGIVLGAIGGGGTLLAVPVLVYLMGLPVIQASSYSMALVGITAWAGTLQYASKASVDFRSAWYFAIPSVLTVMFVRGVVVPNLPEIFFEIFGIVVRRDTFLMLLFAAMLILAAYSMIKSKAESSIDSHSSTIFKPMIAMSGLGEGFLTGLVGAGGGFLIIPALVFIGHIPMRMAIGTSLFIIALKSTFGFSVDLYKNTAIWNSFIWIAGIITVFGSYVGSLLAARLSVVDLKKYFAWFTLLVAMCIVCIEFLKYE